MKIKEKYTNYNLKIKFINNFFIELHYVKMDIIKNNNTNNFNNNLNSLELNLSFDTETDDSPNNTKKLNCYSSTQEEQTNAENELELFEKTNEKTTIPCENFLNPINTHGSSGTIFKGKTPNTFIKYSDLPSETTKLFSRSDMYCDAIAMRINKSINENANSIKYAELNKVLPLNIMKVYNTYKCKNEQGLFSNIIEMEKINGITLNEFITKLNLESSMNSYKLFSCILQLIYISLYANFNGYVHNDLSTNNIMISEYDKTFTLSGLNINKTSYDIEFVNSNKHTTVPIVKLIDFAYSTYISSEKLNGKVIFGETKQIIKIIKKKLQSLNKKFNPLNDIENILNSSLSSTDYLDNFSLNEYRLLDDKDIIANSLDKNNFFVSIRNFLNELEYLTKKIYPNDFVFITNKKFSQSNDENANLINLLNSLKISNETNKINYYDKYLKYKKKYLELKNTYAIK